MEIISEEISFELRTLIKKLYVSVEGLLVIENKKINHINLYHTEWKNNNHTDLLKLICNECKINSESVISFGFINSQKKSYDQHFHIDYNGETETFFIPLVDLDENNGTEYVEFTSKEHNINMTNELIRITNDFITRDEIIMHFDSLNILRNQYNFKYLICKKWAMAKLPYYVFHRGQSNKGTVDRVMFQIIISRTKDVSEHVSKNIFIPDSELDDKYSVVKKIE